MQQNLPSPQDYNDDNFIAPDEESQDEVVIEFLAGNIIRRLRASVSFNSQAGWHIRDRLGVMWALDTGNRPGQYVLNLHGIHVLDRLRQKRDSANIPKS